MSMLAMAATDDWRWLYATRSRRAIKALRGRNMEGSYYDDPEAAKAAVLSMIPPGVTVGRGDSLTLDQLSVMTALESRGQNMVVNPFLKGPDGRDLLDEAAQTERMRECLLADVFLTGTNALTLDGKLVNFDGSGNRVAGMLFGPRRVIVVIGANKIVADVDAALQRIRHVAAPLDARRVVPAHEGNELPCVRIGFCTDCARDDRICNSTVVIERCFPTDKGRIHVVVVGEPLGY